MFGYLYASPHIPPMSPLFIIDLPIDPASSAFMDVGKKIKEKRVQKKLTQQQLASDIDMEKTNLSRIEAGRTNPTLWTLLKISNALQIHVTELLEGIEI